MKDIVIVSYGGRLDDGGVGKEALVGRRKGDTGWLDDGIVEGRYEYRRNLNMK